MKPHFWILFFSLFCSSAIALASLEPLFARAQQAIEQHDYVQAEQLLRQGLAQAPQVPRWRFQLARVLSFQKRYSEALDEYQILVKQHPQNTDYLLGQAQVLAWSGQPQAALPPLRRARRLTPDYLALWRLEWQLLRDLDTAQAQELARAARQRFPEESWEVGASAGAALQTEVEAGFGHEFASDDVDDWSLAYLQFGQRGQQLSWYGEAQATQRFAQNDNALLLGLDYRAHADWSLAAEIGSSPSHRILPRWVGFVGIRRHLPLGWALQLGARRSRYALVDSDSAGFVLDRYWSNYYLAYTLSRTEIDSGEAQWVNRLQGQYYYHNSSYVGLMIANGDELEYDGSAAPPISHIKALSLYGRHWFTQRWGMSYGFAYHQQGELYKRNGIRIGIRYRY